MKVDVVVDVGNTRIKWGRCTPEGVKFLTFVTPNDRAIWQQEWERTKLTSDLCWAVCGVNPKSRDIFAQWLRGRSASVLVVDSYRQLPLIVSLEFPSQVGIDRLLDAVAALSRVQRPECKIIIDAGTAVTVDCVDGNGVFHGGAILPGFRLMSQVLHDHTALLPKIEISESNPPVPGKSTEGAIRAGVFWAVAGGVKALVRQICARMDATRDRTIFLTGGDSSLLLPVMDTDVTHWPEMTLEGLRIAAEAQP
jgi:type III pantothenate kinase